MGNCCCGNDLDSSVDFSITAPPGFVGPLVAFDLVNYMPRTDRSHLRLGMSMLGMLTWLRNVGFLEGPEELNCENWLGFLRVLGQFEYSKSYRRPSEFKWLDAEYGSEMTGYDLCAFLRTWLTANGKQHLSACEVALMDINLYSILCGRRQKRLTHDMVGIATIYISHAQQDEFMDMLCGICAERATEDCLSKPTISEKEIVWLDYFSVKQGRSDFDPLSIVQLIADIGDVYGSIQSFETYFTRSFCIMEVYAAIKGNCRLEFHEGFNADWSYFAEAEDPGIDEQLAACVANFKYLTKDAQTRNPQDKALIDDYIVNNIPGGFDEVDAKIRTALVNSAAVQG